MKMCFIKNKIVVFMIVVLFSFSLLISSLVAKIETYEEDYIFLKIQYDNLYNENCILDSEIDKLKYENMELERELNRLKNLNKYTIYNIPLTVSKQIYIQELCRAVGFEYKMYLAMLWQESGFKNIVGAENNNGTRDYGIAQLNEQFHEWQAELAGLEKYDVMKVEDNIKMSLAQLKWINNTYGTEGIESVFIYNVGSPIGNLQNQHTKKVMNYYNKLDNLQINY